jgi:hypothetical protein
MQYSSTSKRVCSSACAVVIAAQILGINPSFAVTEIKQAATCQNTQLATNSTTDSYTWWENLIFKTRDWLTHAFQNFKLMETEHQSTHQPKNKLISLSENRKNNNKTNNIIPNFLVLGGGYAPSNNEIALEKNILYFQRTLRELGHNPVDASIFFANGNDGKATIRYLDPQGIEKFKVPQIPNLQGASTLVNLQNWMEKTVQASPEKPIFFYFTGHGIPNKSDLNNNSLTLWDKQLLSVRQLSQILDELPHETSVTVVMAQCFSGSFANLIYQQGNPKLPIALQTRCGFFATIKTLPSVGCTPSVNEADYRDYSSSFFAGLSGRNRIGKVVASADYNKDGKVSYAEAHAFAKVDNKTIDLPISTSESWLQETASSKDVELILQQPIAEIIKNARPEQQYVVNYLVKMFNWNGNQSFGYNLDNFNKNKFNTEEEKAYRERLRMELINISMENQIRNSQNQQAIMNINRLIKCESGFPQ